MTGDGYVPAADKRPTQDTVKCNLLACLGLLAAAAQLVFTLWLLTEDQARALLLQYGHPSFYCALLYCASQMLCFLQIETFALLLWSGTEPAIPRGMPELALH